MAELLADDFPDHFNVFGESGSSQIAVESCKRDCEPHRKIEVRDIVSGKAVASGEPKKL